MFFDPMQTSPMVPCPALSITPSPGVAEDLRASFLLEGFSPLGVLPLLALARVRLVEVVEKKISLRFS